MKTLIPSVRALVAKELINRYKLRQIDVAKMLGVTQAAVSQYLRGARGNVIDLMADPEIMRIVDRLTEGLVNKDLSKKEVSLLACEICYLARKKKLFCESEMRIQGRYTEIADLMCAEYDFSREKGELRETIEKLMRSDR